MQIISATESLLNKSEEEVWFRGEAYADTGRVTIVRADDKGVEAIASGTKKYKVSLKFVANGISRDCSCPYPKGICKHMVATAIIWDEMRRIKRPDKKAIKSYTIAPPAVSRREIDILFNDPLNANLNILRIAADVFARSPREHSRLPNCPKIDFDDKSPLKLKEIEKAFREMERWGKRLTYDPYFCAGEMAAAFCELLQVIEKRISVSEPGVAILIMAHCVDWYYRGFNQMVDSSDGVWLFPTVRIGKVVALLKEKYPSHSAWLDFEKVVKRVGEWWGEPELNREVIAGWKDSRL